MKDNKRTNRGWFKKGVSGNRNGRPRGSKNKKTIAEEELTSLITVTEDGVQKKMEKYRVAYRQQVNQAVKGDTPSFKLIKEDYEQIQNKRVEEQAESAPEVSVSLPSTLTEEEVAKLYYEALKKASSDE